MAIHFFVNFYIFKWLYLYSPRNDPNPEMIPDPEMIPNPEMIPKSIPK